MTSASTAHSTSTNDDRSANDGGVSWAAWLAVVSVAAWTSWPIAALVIAAAVFVGIALFLTRNRSATRLVVLAPLAVAVPALLFATHRINSVSDRWEREWGEREAKVEDRLAAALDDLVVRGDAAVVAAMEADQDIDELARIDLLRSIRDRFEMTAVALFDGDGALQYWDGEHRGRIPEAVSFGAAPYLFWEGPLFSYLYFTRRLPSGAVAVAMSLVRSDLPEGLKVPPTDFSSSFGDRVGVDIRISATPPTSGEPSYDFASGAEGDVLFSVQVDRPSEVERRAELLGKWSRGVGLGVAGLWLLFTLLGRGSSGHARWSIGALLALVLAHQGYGPPQPVFETAFPFGLTLGRLLATAGVGILAGMLVTQRLPVTVPPWIGLSGLALAIPTTVAVFGDAASVGFLADDSEGWTLYLTTLTLLLAAIIGWVMAVVRPGPRGIAWVVAGVALALIGAASATWISASQGSLPVLLAVAWVAPVALLSRFRRGAVASESVLQHWLLATIVASSIAMPFAWHSRIEARRAVAEDQVTRLGTDVDPHLHFMLDRLARGISAEYDPAVDPIEFLYDSWIESDLAREGYPVWMLLLGGDSPRQLQFGTTASRPVTVDLIAEDGRLLSDVEVTRPASLTIHYVATAPLEGGGVAAVAVPPLERLGPVSPLGPLFSSVAGGDDNPLTMIPLLPGDVSPLGSELQWVRVADGWRGELLVTYPNGDRERAQYLVDVAGPVVVTARGTLLLTLSLVLTGVIWIASSLLFGRLGPVHFALGPVLGSFRTQVTVALFAFFLLANAIFGTLAYRTIGGAAQRAATVLATRVTQDAVGLYYEEAGRMELLARQVGADLLEYRDGALREGSAEELVELGVFDGWIPWDVDRVLSGRQSLIESVRSELGAWEYVTAYRRLPDGDVLAAPVPLTAGASAVRRDEFAHLLGFVIVTGGLLSLFLALAVGRTLTRPIEALRSASERVGSGDLNVRVPTERSDEFGEVFTAFDRMVRRLSSAREDLLRTTRRTQAIVEDVAAGVVAFDDGAVVTLVNGTAVELLKEPVQVGEPLDALDGPAHEFIEWVQLYLRDGLPEADAEFNLGGRRLRARARRIFRTGSEGGTVVSLEDVTDELRTERILAWGEMARQVAHEVKNPLTPMKLAIQHIRRAWDDRRPEFGEILTRNADATLGEIDRLASIATSFSRFGAPRFAGTEPLQEVDVESVVTEVLTLYQSGEGGVRFEISVAAEVPTVWARSDEVKEVLVNLLENARAAVEEGEAVHVSVSAVDGGVSLLVRDDGRGIPPKVLPRVFEPHFSTRSAGAGLGLAIVRQLVDSWGGSVSVDSAVDVGTTVTVRMRQWDDEVAPP